MKFTMNVTLGNSAMLTSEDLAQVLRATASRIEDNNYVLHVREEGGRNGLVRKVFCQNGNKVGEFTFQLEESDTE